jgi:hypothetical protein
MTRFFAALLLIGLLSCQYKDESHAEDKSEADANANVTDTTTATIKFEPAQMSMFSETASPATLEPQEIKQIDSTLALAVEDHNKTLGQDMQSMKIDLAGRLYKKQLVAIINSQGEKEVWVNCFCDDFSTPWRTRLLFVDDGGSCYFNLKINLKSRRYYDLRVNGQA